jgi:RNA polymerase sigma-70 factor (ECF subfamily)
MRVRVLDNPKWRVAANDAMDRYARGDDAAFSRLYGLLAPPLYAFLVRRTGDATKAEDSLQQTFFQIHASRRLFTAGADVVPWAFVIVRRLLVDRFRKAKLEEIMAADAWPRGASSAPPDHLAELHHLAARLEKELAGLPEAHRTAFELVRIDGLSIAEAAVTLGTTAGTVKSRVHRACRALRRKLGPTLRAVS